MCHVKCFWETFFRNCSGIVTFSAEGMGVRSEDLRERSPKGILVLRWNIVEGVFSRTKGIRFSEH